MPFVIEGLGPSDFYLGHVFDIHIGRNASLLDTIQECLQKIFEDCVENFKIPVEKDIYMYCPKSVDDLEDTTTDHQRLFRGSITSSCWNIKLINRVSYATNGGWNFDLSYLILEVTPVPTISRSEYNLLSIVREDQTPDGLSVLTAEGQKYILVK
jgi:hypothetical protein